MAGRHLEVFLLRDILKHHMEKAKAAVLSLRLCIDAACQNVLLCMRGGIKGKCMIVWVKKHVPFRENRVIYQKWGRDFLEICTIIKAHMALVSISCVLKRRFWRGSVYDLWLLLTVPLRKGGLCRKVNFLLVYSWKFFLPVAERAAR